MKKIGGVAIAFALSMCMVGCVSQSQETDQSNKMSKETSADMKEFFEQGAEDKAAVAEYLNDDRVLGLMSAFRDIGGMIDAMAVGDYESGSSLNADISERCNSLIEMKDVPESCSDFHNILIEIAKSWRECSSKYSQAASSSDVSKSRQLMDEGTEAMEAGSVLLPDATNELEKIKTKYNLE